MLYRVTTTRTTVSLASVPEFWSHTDLDQALRRGTLELLGVEESDPVFWCERLEAVPPGYAVLPLPLVV
jgi:hypothetical protein